MLFKPGAITCCSVTGVLEMSSCRAGSCICSFASPGSGNLHCPFPPENIQSSVLDHLYQHFELQFADVAK